jgi:type IV pilus assembly protein PilW
MTAAGAPQRQRLPDRRNAGGFGLAEVMVGLAISLLGILMITQMATLFQDRRRSAVAGSQATGQGAMAAHAMERDLRRAGYAFGAASGCQLDWFFDGTQLSAMALSPLSISANAADSDTVLVRFGSRPAATQQVHFSAAHPGGATAISLADTTGMAVGDEIILFEPGRNCLLAQVSGIEPGIGIRHDPGDHRWNPTSFGAIATTGEYTSAGAVVNIGSLQMVEYSVQGGKLQRRVYRSGSNDWQVQTLASGVVLLKAQYGFDTRTGTLSDKRVSSWSSSLVDINGDLSIDQSDLQRLVAVRIALLVQVGAIERARAGSCATTTVAPQWQSGAADGSVTAADLPMAGIGNWQCYRYQVVENVIVFRNMLWQ